MCLGEVTLLKMRHDGIDDSAFPFHLMSNNITLLTQSHRVIAAKKKAKHNQIKEIIFDDEARR